MDNYQFKIEMDVYNPIPRTITKYFKTLKVLRQWQKRTDIENNLYVLECREYIFNSLLNKWERFTIFGKTVVTLSELISVTTKLINNEDQKMKTLKPHFFKSEE